MRLLLDKGANVAAKDKCFTEKTLFVSTLLLLFVIEMTHGIAFLNLALSLLLLKKKCIVVAAEPWGGLSH